jgi:hypothetical protein
MRMHLSPAIAFLSQAVRILLGCRQILVAGRGSFVVHLGTESKLWLHHMVECRPPGAQSVVTVEVTRSCSADTTFTRRTSRILCSDTTQDRHRAVRRGWSPRFLARHRASLSSHDVLVNRVVDRKTQPDQRHPRSSSKTLHNRSPDRPRRRRGRRSFWEHRRDGLGDGVGRSLTSPSQSPTGPRRRAWSCYVGPVTAKLCVLAMR